MARHTTGNAASGSNLLLLTDADKKAPTLLGWGKDIRRASRELRGEKRKANSKPDPILSPEQDNSP